MKNIMIVDDELFFRELLRDILQKAGHTVIAEAADGGDAVEKYRQTRPDVVLMDIFMPGMNGIDATRGIISLDPQASIFMCSGVGYDESVEAAVQAGAKGVVFKPFFDAEILQAIDSV